jgi:hypothetical protein
LGISQCPWRDDTHDLALDRPLGQARLADLLADGDGLALPDEAAQVLIHGVIGHPGHGNRGTARLTPRRQGDVQESSSFLSILEEELVEVTHSVKEQHIGVLALDAQVLLHDRSQFLLICHEVPVRITFIWIKYLC